MQKIKSKKGGFTIFEIIFVMGLFAFIGAISLPYTIDTYKHYLLSTETQMIIGILRRAEGMAIANKYGDSFGVSIQGTQYVLFRGSNYSSRNIPYDELYPKSESVAVLPLSEIVFQPISGKPGQATVFTLSSSGSTQQIDINAQGTINW